MIVISMKESDVTKQCKDFLEWRGWRLFRTHFAYSPGAFSTSEPGCPDWMAIKYKAGIGGLGERLIWCEFKSPNDKRRCTCRPGIKRTCAFCRQQKWQEDERRRGALVWQVNSLEQLEELYRKAFPSQ